MEEEGIVVGIPGRGAALVRMTRSAACRSCCAAGMCHSAEGSPDMEVEVTDPLGVTEGQRVRVAVPSGAVLKASLAVYILPLAILLGVAAVVQKLSGALLQPSQAQLAGVIAGLAAMIGAYAAMRKALRERAERDLRPTIIALVS